MKISQSCWAVVAILGLSASSASAAVIASASGPIRVNDKPVTVRAGDSLALNTGDVVETLGATVAVETADGNRVTLEPGTTARSDGIEDDIEYLFVESGAAYGSVSARTYVGGTAGWASAREGTTGRFFLEVPANRPGSETSFRSVEGEVGVRYHSFTVWIPQQNTVTLAVDTAEPDVLAFRTSQQNPGDVRIEKATGTGTILVIVPKATVGRMRPEDAKRTRIENDITSLKTGKIGLETHFQGKAPQEAALGPGTYALINNETGTIELSFTAVEFVILERAVSLTREFATLSQSNFSDVGNDSGSGK